MADQKIQMPSSGGGLVRYFDDIKTKFEIKPIYVIALIILVVIVELYLYKFL
ncbi:preprotein translocase subunit Sec61beta [Candidatus Woesearchaeota archaeon]|nr:preprotein translocase subunit Sec61beta [Candidatus Woesearchaeota archaeon]